MPGNHGVWLQLGPDRSDPRTRRRRARAAARIVGYALASEREMGQVAAELATRYEEIDLLYTISDILGRTVRLEEAAQTIVREVSSVVGARRASIMVYDEAERLLRVVAGRGLEVGQCDPVPMDDECSIAARVFRSREAMAYDANDQSANPGCPTGRQYRGQSFLSVPILYAPPGGSPRPIGVINLTDRLGEDAFSAGNKKLVTAIANQIGAAIENARLVGEERRQERLSTELAAAHDLQLALLPPAQLLAAAGDVGARCHSAESIGGDFYDIIPLGPETVGVIIGDVSSHGLSAALLMAHAISAATILAQSSHSPEEALRKLLGVIGDELRRAEMFMSLFYGVVYSGRGVLRYANAGHPQAFLVPGDGGEGRRLGATVPPLGLAPDDAITGTEVRWRSGSDLLCLFTDGLSESKNEAGERYGEQRLLAAVRRHRASPAPAIVDAVFHDLEGFSGAVVDDDRTLLLVRR